MPLVLEGTGTFGSRESQFQVSVHRYGPPLSNTETLVKFTSLGHSPKKTDNILMKAARLYRQNDDPHETGFELPAGTRVFLHRDGERRELDTLSVVQNYDDGWIYCVARWDREEPITDLAERMCREDQVATCFVSDATTFALMVGASVAHATKRDSVDVVHGGVEYIAAQQRNRQLESTRRMLDMTKGDMDESKWSREEESWALRTTFTKRDQFRHESEYRFWIPGKNKSQDILDVVLPLPEGVETHFGDVLSGKTGEPIPVLAGVTHG